MRVIDRIVEFRVTDSETRDGFEEGKHPRAENGEFGSGGGKKTSSNQPSQKQVNKQNANSSNESTHKKEAANQKNELAYENRSSYAKKRKAAVQAHEAAAEAHKNKDPKAKELGEKAFALSHSLKSTQE